MRVPSLKKKCSALNKVELEKINYFTLLSNVKVKVTSFLSAILCSIRKK